MTSTHARPYWTRMEYHAAIATYETTARTFETQARLCPTQTGRQLLNEAAQALRHVMGVLNIAYNQYNFDTMQQQHMDLLLCVFSKLSSAYSDIYNCENGRLLLKSYDMPRMCEATRNLPLFKQTGLVHDNDVLRFLSNEASYIAHLNLHYQVNMDELVQASRDRFNSLHPSWGPQSDHSDDPKNEMPYPA